MVHQQQQFAPRRHRTKQPPYRWGTGRQAALDGNCQALSPWPTLLGSANIAPSSGQSKPFTDCKSAQARFTARQGSAPMERGPPASAALLCPATPDAQRWAAFQSCALKEEHMTPCFHFALSFVLTVTRVLGFLICQTVAAQPWSGGNEP